ncbi:MAG: helix-turn-helix domain-containing protein [Muribaculaceae bacterium]|nr:helix-turn-helix domain-containing protein [Muribaculaceae bacterium]
MDLSTAKAVFCTKEVLTTEETAQYLGISKSYLHKLTMRKAIPYYKPLGKKCYFNRKEIEAWLQSNKCASTTEINDRANRILMQRGGVL